MGFLAILSALQPYHSRIHAKVEFPRFPPDVRTGGSTPQLLILNSEMKVLH